MSDEPTTDPAEWVSHEQRWSTCRGHMEREPGRLQVRALLGGGEGVCNVLFEEDEDSVAVLILVCGEADSGSDLTDCPVHIYLERPLGDRIVLDVVNQRRPVPYRNVYRELEKEFPEIARRT